MQKYRHYEEVTYLYDSEKEKYSHSEEMQKQGFEDSGRYGMAFNPLTKKEEFRICGVYCKYHD